MSGGTIKGGERGRDKAGLENPSAELQLFYFSNGSKSELLKIDFNN